jgi:hypothetical protein
MSSNLKSGLNYETVGDLLDAFRDAGMTVRDVEWITSHPGAARAAVLAARNVQSQTNDKPALVKFNKRQIRTMLESASIPESSIEKYESPEDFSCLIARNHRITSRSLDMLAMNLGIGEDDDRPYMMIEVAEHYGLTRERVRQIIHRMQVEIRRLVAVARPPIVDQVTEGVLTKEQKELLTLLG